MFEPTSFKEVIGLWPSPDVMGIEVGAGVFRSRKWFTRDRIPAEWWEPVLDSETAKAAGLTAAMLTRLAARARTEEVQA